MLVVIALGGNALQRRGGSPTDAAVQRANVKVAAEAIAEVASDHRVVLTHGAAPRSGSGPPERGLPPTSKAYPLDVLDAETEGMVGYLLEQELGRHLPPDRLATLLTQIVVDPDDYAFPPTRPSSSGRRGTRHATRSLYGDERGLPSPLTATSMAARRPPPAPHNASSSSHDPDARRPWRHRHLRRRRRHPPCSRRSRRIARDRGGHRQGPVRVLPRSRAARRCPPPAHRRRGRVRRLGYLSPAPHPETPTRPPPAARPRGGARWGPRSTRCAGSSRLEVRWGAIGNLSQAAMLLDGQAGTDRPPPRGLNRSEVEDQVDHTVTGIGAHGQPRVVEDSEHPAVVRQDLSDQPAHLELTNSSR